MERKEFYMVVGKDRYENKVYGRINISKYGQSYSMTRDVNLCEEFSNVEDAITFLNDYLRKTKTAKSEDFKIIKAEKLISLLEEEPLIIPRHPINIANLMCYADELTEELEHYDEFMKQKDLVKECIIKCLSDRYPKFKILSYNDYEVSEHYVIVKNIMLNYKKELK